MQWRVRRFFWVNGHGLFFGNGCGGTVSLAPATLPWKNRWLSLCTSLQVDMATASTKK